MTTDERINTLQKATEDLQFQVDSLLTRCRYLSSQLTGVAALAGAAVLYLLGSSWWAAIGIALTFLLVHWALDARRERKADEILDKRRITSGVE